MTRLATSSGFGEAQKYKLACSYRSLTTLGFDNGNANCSGIRLASLQSTRKNGGAQ